MKAGNIVLRLVCVALVWGGAAQVEARSLAKQVNSFIVDLAVGLKVNLFGSAVGFVTVFLPLNDDGLRSDLIPAVGLEVSF